MNFSSDNATGVAPEIMAALARANEGAAMAYGADDLTARAQAALAALFECELEAYPVATGTAANALGLAALVPPYGVIFAHENAHVEEDECGAPEFYSGGAKIRTLPGAEGRLTPEARQCRVHPSAIDTADLKPLSDDPQEILDEALCYACGTGQIDVANYLLSLGADANGEPYYGKPFHFAVWNESASADRLANKQALADFPLARGADVNGRDGRGFGAWRRAVQF